MSASRELSAGILRGYSERVIRDIEDLLAE
jgi:hypothetical protein